MWTRVHGPPVANAIVREARGKFNPINQQDLTQFLSRGQSGQFGHDQAIYIAPPPKEKSAVAALWCRWDFDLAPPKCAFYFGIWSEKPSFPTVDTSEGSKHTAFVGFRYETPEVGDNHAYYHAQPCRSMGARDDPIVHALPLSWRYPTFPLAAKSPLDLLLCLVVSLYGMNGLSEMQAQILEDGGMRKNTCLRNAFDEILSIKLNMGSET